MENVVVQRRSLGGLLTFGAGLVVLGGAGIGSVMAAPTADQVELVRKAYGVLDEAHHDSEFGNSAELFRTARGVMVVPQLVKGGFWVGTATAGATRHFTPLHRRPSACKSAWKSPRSCCSL
jgi:hypothetical protein